MFNIGTIFASVNGNWALWSDWNNCTLPCDGGTQNRSRTCTDPQPQYGGDDCVGNEADVQTCNAHICPSKVWIAVTCKWCNM